MARPPLYHVKKRSVEAARPNTWGMRVRHGKWFHVSSWLTEAEAMGARSRVQGLYDVGVFYAGKRVDKED